MQRFARERIARSTQDLQIIQRPDTAARTQNQRAVADLDIRYRHGRTLYRITFTAVAADARPAELVLLDGRPIAGTTVPLSDDGAEHTVDMKVPADPAPGRDTADGRPPLSAKTP
jgi:hypothetical protein